MAAVIQEEHMSGLASDGHSQVRRIAIEFGIAMLIVLLFFFIVFGIMNLYFPIGTSVKDLAQTIGTSVSKTGPRDLFVARPEAKRLLAKITEIGKKVNVKSAGNIAWSTAQVGMSLSNRDAIQTYRHARALIEFDDSNYLDIGENSLVVFQGMEPDLFVNQLRTYRVMVEGELRGKLQQSGEGLTNLQVALPGAEVHMLPSKEAGGDVEFKLAVNKDKSSTLSVYKGGAEIMVQGKSIMLGENAGLTIGPDGKALGPVALPSQPIPKWPRDRSVSYYRKLPPKIVFSWKPAEPVAAYRFMLARDPEFRQLVVDERLKRTTFTHGNLKKGRYYWRVHALVDDVEGTPSAPRQLRMVQDRTPPVLRLQTPPKVIYQPAITLLGRTEPGAKVYVEGAPVKVNGRGLFTHRLRVKPGATLVVVEAVDAAGNVAYVTSLVNGKF